MAPATLAGAQPRTLTRRGGWDRDTIIDAIREWVALYGEPPRSADWNPSVAKWSGQLWRVERYRAGRPDGRPWPSLNAAKRPFGGSLSEAVLTAGFEPGRPGPKPSARPAASGGSVCCADRAAALARAREAERRAAELEQRLAQQVRPACARPATGPAGPAVLAAALKSLAGARAGGNPTAMRAALGEIAHAAVTWQERI